MGRGVFVALMTSGKLRERESYEGDGIGSKKNLRLKNEESNKICIELTYCIGKSEMEE